MYTHCHHCSAQWLHLTFPKRAFIYEVEPLSMMYYTEIHCNTAQVIYHCWCRLYGEAFWMPFHRKNPFSLAKQAASTETDNGPVETGRKLRSGVFEIGWSVRLFLLKRAGNIWALRGNRKRTKAQCPLRFVVGWRQKGPIREALRHFSDSSKPKVPFPKFALLLKLHKPPLLPVILAAGLCADRKIWLRGPIFVFGLFSFHSFLLLSLPVRLSQDIAAVFR